VIGGPTRAIAVTNFLKECGIEPTLIVSDFDVNTAARLSGLVSERCEVLIAPEHETILERCKAQRVDLIVGGMLERPIASSLGAEHLDIMHGSEKPSALPAPTHCSNGCGVTKSRDHGRMLGEK
jgi:nitrogenase molybdenum-iron protein alpha/beta subunit